MRLATPRELYKCRMFQITTISSSWETAAHVYPKVVVMRKRTVKLHGRHCEISVHREGKHIWFAVGDYLGKEIRAQAESEGAAVKRWRETASTMGATERAGRE